MLVNLSYTNTKWAFSNDVIPRRLQYVLENRIEVYERYTFLVRIKS